MARAFLCAVVLLHIPSCAHFCGDTGHREGVWGIVFHCQSRETLADPMQAREKAQPAMPAAEAMGT